VVALAAVAALPSDVLVLKAKLAAEANEFSAEVQELP